jgi:cell wall-associated NlpC family hydrolase
MNEAKQRKAIVEEALSWLGTKWHHRAAIKGVGCDCALFPMAVYKSVGLVPASVAVEDYPQDWAMHRDEERYLAMVERFGKRIDIAALAAGDFVVWHFGRAFSHGGISLGGTCIIHAYQKVGHVTIDDFSNEMELMDRDKRAYSFWGSNNGRA